MTQNLDDLLAEYDRANERLKFLQDSRSASPLEVSEASAEVGSLAEVISSECMRLWGHWHLPDDYVRGKAS